MIPLDKEDGILKCTRCSKSEYLDKNIYTCTCRKCGENRKSVEFYLQPDNIYGFVHIIDFYEIPLYVYACQECIRNYKGECEK